jgi:hypothetical protein
LACRPAGAAIAALAFAAALGLKLGALCFGDACTQELLLLGRPVSDWGLAAYALSLPAFLFAPRFILVPWAGFVFLAHGALYVYDPVPCPVCVGTLLADFLLLVLAVKSGDPRKLAFPQAAASIAAVAVAAVSLSAVSQGARDISLPVMERGADFYAGERTGEGPREPGDVQDKSVSPASKQETVEPCSDWTAGCFVRLASPDGTVLFVDLRASPVVVFSPGCRHCDRVLETVSTMTEKPVLAATHPAGVEEKLAAAGLAGSEWYVLAESPPRGLPALIFWDGRREVALGASDVSESLLKKPCR